MWYTKLETQSLILYDFFQFYMYVKPTCNSFNTFQNFCSYFPLRTIKHQVSATFTKSQKLKRKFYPLKSETKENPQKTDSWNLI